MCAPSVAVRMPRDILTSYLPPETRGELSFEHVSGPRNPTTQRVAMVAMDRVRTALEEVTGLGVDWNDSFLVRDLLHLMDVSGAGRGNAGILPRPVALRLAASISKLAETNADFWRPLTSFWLGWIAYLAYHERQPLSGGIHEMMQSMDTAAERGIWVTNASLSRLLSRLEGEARERSMLPDELEAIVEHVEASVGPESRWGIELTREDELSMHRVRLALSRQREDSRKRAERSE